MTKSPVTFKTGKANPQAPQITDVDAVELNELAPQVHIVDVRTSAEYVGELGHIQSSQHLVLDSLPARLRELPKNEPIVFVCKSGGRSAQATAFAASQGFQHVYNMAGGMMRWNQLGLPIKK